MGKCQFARKLATQFTAEAEQYDSESTPSEKKGRHVGMKVSFKDPSTLPPAAISSSYFPRNLQNRHQVSL
jgi:hypothetical protein